MHELNLKIKEKIRITEKQKILIVLLSLLVVAVVLWRVLNPMLEPVERFSIIGTVKDWTTGEPLTEAKVSIARTGRAVDLTRSDGSYKISIVPSGTRTLKVKFEGYETHQEKLNVTEDLTVNVILMPSGIKMPCEFNCPVITGNVMDGQTGEPVAGASVNANGYLVKTGPDGRYELKVEKGAYTLEIKKKNYHTKTASVNAPEEKQYSINATLTRVPTIEVTAFPNEIETRNQEKTVEIKAIVFRSDGGRAIGIRVNFKSSEEVPGEFNSPTVTTDDEGIATTIWTYTGKKNYHYKFLFVTVSTTIEDQQTSSTTSVMIGLQRCEDCH